MGRLFLDFFSDESNHVYICKRCLSNSPSRTKTVHLASSNDLVSKSLHSRNGPAYLFRDVVNVFLGPTHEREMQTGIFAVQDVFCKSCSNLIGWRYERSYEDSEKYKENAVALEKLQLANVHPISLNDSGSFLTETMRSNDTPGRVITESRVSI